MRTWQNEARLSFSIIRLHLCPPAAAAAAALDLRETGLAPNELSAESYNV